MALGLAACGGGVAGELAGATPRARLSAPLYAPLGAPVLLDAGASCDPDGTVVGYTFSFNDGSPDTTLSLAEVSHVFDRAGAYEVVVVVADDDGLLSRATQLVVVRSDPPDCSGSSDCSLGAECRTDLGLCYANGPGVGSGGAECLTDSGCSPGSACRAGLCLSVGTVASPDR